MPLPSEIMVTQKESLYSGFTTPLKTITILLNAAAIPTISSLCLSTLSSDSESVRNTFLTGLFIDTAIPLLVACPN